MRLGYIVLFLFSFIALAEETPSSETFRNGQVLDTPGERGSLSRAALKLEKELGTLIARRSRLLLEIQDLQDSWDGFQARKQQAALPLRRFLEPSEQAAGDDLDGQLSEREDELQRLDSQISAIEAGLRLLRARLPT